MPVFQHPSPLHGGFYGAVVCGGKLPGEPQIGEPAVGDQRLHRDGGDFPALGEHRHLFRQLLGGVAEEGLPPQTHLSGGRFQ